MIGPRRLLLTPHTDGWLRGGVGGLAGQLSRPRIAVPLSGALALASIGFFAHGLGNPLGTDYLATLTGARLLAGHLCLYCDATQINVQSQLLHQPIGRPDAFLAPPGQALIARPLLALPPEAGFAVFGGLSLAAALAAAVLGWRRLRDGVPDAWQRTVLVMLTVFSLPAAWNYWLGQWDALLLLVAGVAVIALDRGMPVVAGFALSALLMKPQLGWLLPIGFAVATQWRLLAGFAGGAALWVISSLALVGADQLGRWPGELAFRAPQIGTSVGVPGLAAMLGGGRIGVLVAFVSAVSAAALLWRFRARVRSSPQTVVALCLALSAAVAPHIFAYDLILLAVPLWLVGERRHRAAIVCAALLSVAYLVDHYGPYTGAPLETLVVVAIVVLLLSADVRRKGPRVVDSPVASIVRPWGNRPATQAGSPEALR